MRNAIRAQGPRRLRALVTPASARATGALMAFSLEAPYAECP